MRWAITIVIVVVMASTAIGDDKKTIQLTSEEQANLRLIQAQAMILQAQNKEILEEVLRRNGIKERIEFWRLSDDLQRLERIDSGDKPADSKPE